MKYWPPKWSILCRVGRKTLLITHYHNVWSMRWDAHCKRYQSAETPTLPKFSILWYQNVMIPTFRIEY